MTANYKRTIIIGGGIVGVCAAYELAKRGQPVTLVEAKDIGAGASFGNAGIIAIGHAPLPRPGLAIKVLKWMLHGDSPLYIPPRFDWEMIKWFWNFHRACTPGRFEECMKVLGELGRLSWDAFERIVNEESLDVEYHRDGWMEVYNTKEGFETGKHEGDIIRDNGFEVINLEQDELLRREPALKDSVVGGVLYTESAFTDPMRFLMQLSQAAKRHGAEIRDNCPVEEIVVRNGKFAGVRTSSGEIIEGDVCVLAAGIWSTALAKSMGLYIPMQAGKGYHRNVVRPEPCVSVATVLAEDHVAVTPMGDTLRLAGTVEFSGINNKLTPRRLEMMSVSARKYLRGLEKQTVVGEWCGLRPCTADGLPVIGWAPAPGIENIFIATGHARMGLALAPATGRIVAGCLLDGRSPMVIELMRADRFGRVKARAVKQTLKPAPA